jgi:hypothetical protein
MLRPLFPGSTEADEIYKICSVLGSPNMRTWSEGVRLATQMSFRFPQFVPTPLQQVIPNASPEAIHVMEDLLKYDPNQRPTASQTLQYPFFQANATLPAINTGGRSSLSAEFEEPIERPKDQTKAEEDLPLLPPATNWNDPLPVQDEQEEQTLEPYLQSKAQAPVPRASSNFVQAKLAAPALGPSSLFSAAGFGKVPQAPPVAKASDSTEPLLLTPIQPHRPQPQLSGMGGYGGGAAPSGAFGAAHAGGMSRFARQVRYQPAQGGAAVAAQGNSGTCLQLPSADLVSSSGSCSLQQCSRIPTLLWRGTIWYWGSSTATHKPTEARPPRRGRLRQSETRLQP